MKQRHEINPNTPESWDNAYSKVKKERVNDWLYPHLFPELPETGTVLEVGCGMGQTLRDIKKHNLKLMLWGMDYSKNAIEAANQIGGGVAFASGDFMDFEFVGKYEMIFCIQSLEHFDKPKESVLRMKELSSKVFITVPYPGTGLDTSIFWHQWSFSKTDFEEWLPGCEIKKEGNHMLIIWSKI